VLPQELSDLRPDALADLQVARALHVEAGRPRRRHVDDDLGRHVREELDAAVELGL
jgi:hypothetical protein